MGGILGEMASLWSVAIALFGVAYCLMQTQHSRVSQCFAIFLAVIALNNMPDAFARLLSTGPRSYISIAQCVTWPTSFFLAPLFWVYVHVLTSPEPDLPPRLGRHFAVPVVAILIAIPALMSPPVIRDTLFSDDAALDTGWAMTLGVFMGLLQLMVIPQIAFYLVLIVRRLLRFRVKLLDVYSSTERHELRWIYVIATLSGAFWLATTFLFLAALGLDRVPPSFGIPANLAGVVLVSALTLWGIRQRPPLAPDTEPAPTTPTGPQNAGKYEKSALSPQASERLSRKLRAAMEVDRLHRDANLSLWALARHTGASPNYISQTLNEVIGESFFDFVNSYRINEAKTLLATTDDSVLAITYDVGFNARSSFYNAFKRHTGQTPTTYRKNMSQRDGLDDITEPLHDT